MKAYSIICVVIAHLLPITFYKYILFQVWGDMQVPMFVLIQVFHAYKKGVRPKLNGGGILKRIFLPFVAVQGVILGFKALTGEGVLLTKFLIRGGTGPGSYYIWIYLQIAILLVAIWPWLKKISLKQVTAAFFVISVGFEVLFSVISFPDSLYRLLCIRYLFLIPLGMRWIEKGVEINWKTIILSVFSIIAVLFFVFTQYNLEPLFYNTIWKFHRWICYFYLPFLLTYGLYIIWSKIKESKWIVNATKWTAARTYEIFLAQMAILACISKFAIEYVSNDLVLSVIWAICAFTLSFVFGGLIYSHRKSILKW